VVPALDIDAPSFLDSFPRTANVTSSSVELVVQINEPGVVYYTVLSRGAREPTAREMKERLRSDLVSSGVVTDTYLLTRETSKVITGLSASANYTLYAIAEDNALGLRLQESPNIQASPTALAFETS